MIWNNLSGKILMTFIISMAPVIELRGAIPIAVANGLNLQVAIVTSILGNLLPVPFIILFVRKIFAWLRKKSLKCDSLVTRIERRAEKKSAVVQRYAFWGLALFVAIPLPGTGAWTGALISAMLNMRLNRAFISIALGVVAAGCLVAFVTYGVACGISALSPG